MDKRSGIDNIGEVVTKDLNMLKETLNISKGIRTYILHMHITKVIHLQLMIIDDTYDKEDYNL